jgi:hypothetical protein
MDKLIVPPRRTVKFKVGRVMRLRLDETPTIVDEATGLAIQAQESWTKTKVVSKKNAVS